MWLMDCYTWIWQLIYGDRYEFYQGIVDYNQVIGIDGWIENCSV